MPEQEMKIILAIGTGSFIGGIFRYLLAQFVQSKLPFAFPYGTLCVNIIGCFLIGIVFGISERVNLDTTLRLFLITGLIGGFTTFSAFSYETLGLLRTGHLWVASAYVISSVLIGLLATFTGYMLFKLG